MFMVLLVLHDPDNLDAVLAAWSAIGLRGATVLESTGLYRRQAKHIPMPYAYGDCAEEGNYTLFAIVEHEEMVKMCLEATERIIGNLDDPDTGVLAAWPLAQVKGVKRTPPQSPRSQREG
jgi:hypothetical protein